MGIETPEKTIDDERLALFENYLTIDESLADKATGGDDPEVGRVQLILHVDSPSDTAILLDADHHPVAQRFSLRWVVDQVIADDHVVLVVEDDSYVCLLLKRRASSQVCHSHSSGLQTHAI